MDLKALKQAVAQYQAQVAANKKQPFFNNTDNTPQQWIGKVAQDAKQRGPFEAAQDLTYPVLMNPYVEPIEEPLVGQTRVANAQAERPSSLVNSLLGQTDSQVPSPPPTDISQALAKLIATSPDLLRTAQTPQTNPIAQVLQLLQQRGKIQQ